MQGTDTHIVTEKMYEESPIITWPPVYMKFPDMSEEKPLPYKWKRRPGD
jgi:hypothetical protein